MHRNPQSGGDDRFPVTRQSAVIAAKSADRAVRARAIGALIAAYWRPVYKHLRIKWRAEPSDAMDLTQGFFARSLEDGAGVFERYDPSQAKFRTFLRTCLDRYVSNERKAARRLKRGGAALPVPLDALDFEAAEGELAVALAGGADRESPEEAFQREWARSVLELGVQALQERCEARGKPERFRIFEQYDLHDAASFPSARPTYHDLARDFGVPVTQITNELAAARRELRALLMDRLRDTTGSEAELRDEARALLGIEPA